MLNLGKFFRGSKAQREEPKLDIRDEVQAEAPEEEKVPEEVIFQDTSFPQFTGDLLEIWRQWAGGQVPPALSLTGQGDSVQLPWEGDALEQERQRLYTRIEQCAKRRMQKVRSMEKNMELPQLDAECECCVSKDKMVAWAFVFPPVGEGQGMSPAMLGKAMEQEGVTTGVQSMSVARMAGGNCYFDLIPLALGTPAVEGTDGMILEHFPHKVEQEVKIDEDGQADYRSLNYVQLVKVDTVICDIVPAVPGESGVRVDGKVIEPRKVKAAKPPKGPNTRLSEDGLQLLASQEGDLQYEREVYTVRPVLEINGDVDYSTGNVDFPGDVHIHGDVRENFVVRAKGSVFIDGLVEAATVEAGGDLLISRGVVGDDRALLRSRGTVRVKYLESCNLYATGSVHADCIVTCNVFCDDSVSVISGRGSIIGGVLVVTKAIRARMIGARSGRITELTLGTRPCVQNELEEIEKSLAEVHQERVRNQKDIAYLTNGGDQGENGIRLSKAKVKSSALEMQEQQLIERRDTIIHAKTDLSKCCVECEMAYPVTKITVAACTQTVDTERRYYKLGYSADTETLREYA